MWVIRYTNQERDAAGLEPFLHDPDISDTARGHSVTMTHSGLFHTIQGRGPTDRALPAGYSCRAYHADGSYSYGLSENIAEHPRITMWGVLGSSGKPEEFYADAQDVAYSHVRSWMNSPGHRANIPDPEAHRIGVGVAIAEMIEYGLTQETTFATQKFSAYA